MTFSSPCKHDGEINLPAQYKQRCLATVKAEKGRQADGTITLTEFIKFALTDPLVLRPLSMLEKIQISRNCKILQHLFWTLLL